MKLLHSVYIFRNPVERDANRLRINPVELATINAVITETLLAWLLNVQWQKETIIQVDICRDAHIVTKIDRNMNY